MYLRIRFTYADGRELYVTLPERFYTTGRDLWEWARGLNGHHAPNRVQLLPGDSHRAFDVPCQI